MTFSVHVCPGVAIGRAVLVASSRLDVAHYFISPSRWRARSTGCAGRNAVVDELQRLQAGHAQGCAARAGGAAGCAPDAAAGRGPDQGVKHWIRERLYNAEWALTTQLEVISRQFDEMEDEYLRERKADLEQVVERILRYMKGVASPVAPPASSPRRKTPAGQDCCWMTRWMCRWCWWRTTCRRPTCCSSSKACSPGL
jgi:phosphotransferase system enzyme I (PtsI)